MPDLVWYDRHLVGFENRLKDENRVKDKIAESLAVKGRTVDEAVQLIPERWGCGLARVACPGGRAAWCPVVCGMPL